MARPYVFSIMGTPIWTPIYCTPYSRRVPLILGHPALNPETRNQKPILRVWESMLFREIDPCRALGVVKDLRFRV